VSLRAEEANELLKSLRRERDDLTTEVSTLKEGTNDWIMKFTESSEQNRVNLERIADLETLTTETAAEREHLLGLMNSSGGSIKAELLHVEDECVELRAENKRLVRESDRLKRQLDKVQEQKLVLEHDLAVAEHENKQREEELHSLQTYMDNKSKCILYVCVLVVVVGHDAEKSRKP
jgi:cell division protein FtsB